MAVKYLLNKTYKKLVRPVMKKIVAAKTEEMPKVDLENKHVANARVLRNRLEMLDRMPKNGVVAELGVDQGEFSREIINRTNPSKLHLVDVWSTKKYDQSKQHGVEQKFAKEIESKKVEINLGYSTEVGNGFADNYFDWVYIDTDHSYKTTKAELNIFAPKVKEGGVIAGHDYIIASWNVLIRYGVIEAVHEFCSENDWEILYITNEQTNNPSFAIRKIQAKS